MDYTTLVCVPVTAFSLFTFLLTVMAFEYLEVERLLDEVFSLGAIGDLQNIVPSHDRRTSLSLSFGYSKQYFVID